ncbi:Predicted DNA-binding transcriptional regulator YafY, contains an HTH and WYL domains [Lentzea albidocapillata subsp. violacea]|uniref:Predicted DNA-binding transcriptional regulator YafY, contains an HTH and WYL domains n=1 Tax=Lentzea albidocapillata subsp. violacea TaxID=128104 RepID=A0A1G8V4L3_9PSEU|nr:WYL domain-containing protein [Lentzea albidocapillata]SDJ61018.1 Predicted DNA-binding transcriptional regulator YafY, contains an HTH and WYL domains [Lentzea albidocapillata subsp. violacea]
MRADRLVATLLLMQARGRVTAAELAEELEVSNATARRDLEALSAAGVPVYPQPGRGGGWSLVGGARTDLSGLTSAEAQALFLVAGPAASVAPEIKSALRKLVRALPQTFRAEAEAAADATIVDTAAWGEDTKDRSALATTLQQAVVKQVRVRLTYQKRGEAPTEREVDPWGLVDKDGTWYFIAGTGDGRRTFRLDRILGVSLTGTPSSRPAGFELAGAWDEVVTSMEARRSETSATVLVPTRFLKVFQHQHGRHCTVVEEQGEHTKVELTAPRPLDIARNVAGWGGLITVESPEVEEHLARIGAELVSRYPRAAPAAPAGT